MPQLVGTVFEEMVSQRQPRLRHVSRPVPRRLPRARTRTASDELKSQYLPKLVDGTWSGTMCLTEPQCGTDLGLIRTRAEPAEDGSYRITGTKIFISAGEHDLTENIIHLVLAKLPGAPAGTRGISLFLVPKFLPTGRQARAAQRRRLRQHRAQDGHPASATALLNFDDAKGWLVGQREPGHALHVHHDERGAARRRHAGARRRGGRLPGGRAYAKDRRQGKSLAKGAKCRRRRPIRSSSIPTCAACCSRSAAMTEAGRALAYWVGLELDRAERTSPTRPSAKRPTISSPC